MQHHKRTKFNAKKTTKQCTNYKRLNLNQNKLGLVTFLIFLLVLIIHSGLNVASTLINAGTRKKRIESRLFNLMIVSETATQYL